MKEANDVVEALHVDPLSDDEFRARYPWVA